MNSTRIKLGKFAVEDIPLGMRLKTMARWNQLATDWATLLSMTTGGSYLAYLDNDAAGTVTTVQYDQQFSWIGMVLVDPRFRGLGIGTKLLKAAIDFARPTGPVLLDATPQGRKLYLTLGFTDICPLERLEIAQLPVIATPADAAITIIPMTAAGLDACTVYDQAHFGASRRTLLQSFFENAPEYAFIARDTVGIRGYCLGRHGSTFEQIGPVVADDEATARALFLAAASQLSGRSMIIDILSEQTDWRQFLLDLGFTVQRPFTRMSLGDWTVQGDRSGQYAIAGPEFG